MKKILVPLLALLSVASISTSKNGNLIAINDGVIYHTDFEGFMISSTSTADVNTGFVWANDWQNSHSIKRGANTLFDISVYDNTEFSGIGGFGIGSNSNLGKLKNGESYTCETHLEYTGMEKLYVEFVGDKWGSCILTPDGSIMENPGGGNITNISYKDNILKFTFCMDYNTGFGVNGYIQFTAYNAKNAHMIIDDVSIRKEKVIMNETFSGFKAVEFDTHTATYFNNFYAADNVKSEYIDVNGNMKAKMSANNLPLTEGKEMFYLNKLGFITKKRQYEVSFDIELENISNLWIYYGGTWATPVSYAQIIVDSNTFELSGNNIKDFKYENGKVSFILDTTVRFTDYRQFEFIAQGKAAGESSVTLDNIRFYQIPVFDSLTIDTSAAKTQYYYGEKFDSTGINIIANYTNEEKEQIALSDVTFEGFDPNKIGLQIITVKYKDVIAYYNVYVNRKLVNLTINTDQIKTNYQYGESLDLSNMVVVANFENNLKETLVHGVLCRGYFIDYGGYDAYKPGTYTICVNYLNNTSTFNVTVAKSSSVSFDVTYEPTGGK